MSDLVNKIQDDLKAAMRAKAGVELGTLRMLKSDIQYEMTKTGAETLPDAEVLIIIKRAIKKRRESIEQFRKGGREEQAVAEEQEAAVLERYLPASIPDSVIEGAIAEVLAAVPGASSKDMGKVMGQVMARLKGQNADGARVRELVQGRLASS